MNAKPTILIVDNSRNITGALNAILRNASALSSVYQFVFVIPERSNAEAWVRKQGIGKVYTVPFRELSKSFVALTLYLPSLLLNVLAVSKIVRKEKPRLIHNNDLYNLIPPLYRVLGGSIPYVCHVRFMPDKFPKWLYNFWVSVHLRWAARIIAVSDVLKHQLPDSDKIVRVYDSTPSNKPVAATIKNLGSGNLLYVANYVNGKGQDYALLAFAKLLHRFPSWKLRFVGGTLGLKKNEDFKRNLIETAARLNIAGNVEWDSFADNVELLYQSHDIALNFSESESFSITCLDALFYGCPIVATRSGGPAEIIRDKETGLLVPVGDVHAMETAMQSLMGNEQLRKEISERGKAFVRENFNPQRIAAQLSDIYESAMNRHERS